MPIDLVSTCYGTNCKHRPVWKVRLADSGQGGWLGACGKHLAWVSTGLTAGEAGVLDLVRVLTDER
jgi:hypothetical protein